MDIQEAGRLDALRRYAILDTPPEPNFDRVTRLASSVFGYPIATLAFLDGDRYWFKARHGLSATEMPRRMAFCDETVQSTDVFVVLDAIKDERFARAPVVTAAPHIRFYAGAPLVTQTGACIGSLCVLGTEPQREFSRDHRQILRDLAATAIELLEARAREIELSRCTLEIAHLARHDSLTGLANRRRLREMADAAMEGVGDAQGIALLYLDLDFFKSVNDRHGHACGDRLLMQVADRLRAALPAEAGAVRLGGDEFAVLLVGSVDLELRAGAVADGLVAALERPYRIGDHLLRVGVSIGIAVAWTKTDLEEMMRQADGALYVAKSTGRGRVCFAAEEPQPERRSAAG